MLCKGHIFRCAPNASLVVNDVRVMDKLTNLKLHLITHPISLIALGIVAMVILAASWFVLPPEVVIFLLILVVVGVAVGIWVLIKLNLNWALNGRRFPSL